MKATIVILSDPKNGSEEALGRVFNGLAAAYDFKQAGDEVSVVFQGTGTRWIGELSKKDHAAHDLFEAVKDQVAGVSCGCADVFGVSEDAEKSGFDLIKENPYPEHGVWQVYESLRLKDQPFSLFKPIHVHKSGGGPKLASRFRTGLITER